jgi:hypothetical protein
MRNLTCASKKKLSPEAQKEEEEGYHVTLIRMLKNAM